MTLSGKNKKTWVHYKSRAKQPDLFGKAPPTSHGGALAEGKRKTARPIATKRPMHVVVRSSRATGNWSLLTTKNRQIVSKALKTAQNKFNVEVIDSANVGNHIHLILKAKTRDAYKGFMRLLVGKIAFEVMGAKKGEAKGRFFDGIPFSRVLNWGRDLQEALIYITKNLLEGQGLVLQTLQGPVRFLARDGTLRSLAV